MSYPPTILTICRVVSQHCKVSREEIESTSRKAAFVRCRHIIAYLCFKLTQRGPSMIGRAIGRHYTTVMYARDEIKAELHDDPDLARELADLETEILNASGEATKYEGRGHEQTSVHEAMDR